MRFPKMKPRVASELKIPDLAGGLNLRDGLSEVLDNQLTDCKNMWWQDGLLRTRPGFKEMETETVCGMHSDDDLEIKRHNCFFDSNSQKGQLCSKFVSHRDIETGTYENYINFFWLFGTRKQALNSIYEITSNPMSEKYFVCRKGDLLYCFTHAKNIYKLDIKNFNNEWVKMEEDERYIPLVMAYCNKIHTDNPSNEEIAVNGEQLEGYNMLSDYYKMSFNSFTPNYYYDNDLGGIVEVKEHDMLYHILEDTNKSKYAGKKVKAEYRTSSGTHKHEVTLNGNGAAQEVNASTDNLKMKVEGNKVYFLKADGSVARVSSGGEDDLVITAPYIDSEKDKYLEKVFNMTYCEWFGGGSAGLAGGTRLFLCGHETEPSLVVWTGLDNPLYFPENSYFYVGETTGAVTGFGKQSDMLVIFKENEVWYTKYQQDTGITASDLINQSVVDYTSASVYFPLVQINPYIGCSYPDTIQLCRNRLVWLGDDGNVYTLVSEDQYNERSIFCVSEMVKKTINSVLNESLTDICRMGISACDWNGYYCLLLADNLFLMDYNCYGYTHIASYSKTEDANLRIPWYFWKTPFAGTVFSVENTLNVVNYEYESARFSNIRFIYADTDLNYDNMINGKQKIKSSFSTKLFDFGQPNVRKNVDKINLQLGNNGGEVIKVRIITECGEEEQEITLTGTQTQSYTPGYIDSKAIFPCIRQTVKIGLELSSTGVLAIDGMNFKYRLTGGCR